MKRYAIFAFTACAILACAALSGCKSSYYDDQTTVDCTPVNAAQIEQVTDYTDARTDLDQRDCGTNFLAKDKNGHPIHGKIGHVGGLRGWALVVYGTDQL